MPATVDIDYLDGEFTVTETEPSTLAELTELIGEQAIVDETTSNLRYRGKYPRVYRKVSDAIVTEFPKPQKTEKDGSPMTKTVKGKDGAADAVVPVPADPTAHLRAFLATGEAAKARLAELFATIAPAELLYAPGERKGGGGKVAQWAVDEANKRFAAEDSDALVEKTAAVVEENVPGYKVGRDADGAVTPDSLARAIAVFKKHEDAKAKASVLGKLG